MLDGRDVNIVQISENLRIKHVFRRTMLFVQNLQVFFGKHRDLGFFSFLIFLLALVLDLDCAKTLAESALQRAFPLGLPMLEHQLRMGREALHRAIIQRERRCFAHD